METGFISIAIEMIAGIGESSAILGVEKENSCFQGRRGFLAIFFCVFCASRTRPFDSSISFLLFSVARTDASWISVTGLCSLAIMQSNLTALAAK